MTSHIRNLLVVLTALAFLPVSAPAEEGGLSAAAEERKAQKFTPTGSVTIKAITVKVGVGVSWGEGILTFQNENHPFKVSGLSLVGVGGSSVDARGTVFNLEKLEDFAGTWAEVSGAAVLGKESAGGITMRNGSIYMTLSGARKGAQLSAGGGGLTISFVDEPAPPPAE